MPNFWDTLKDVGLKAASTAGAVYQSSLGAFSGVANSKISQVANSVQSQVGQITKPSASQPANTPSQPAPAALQKSAASISIAVLAIGALAAFFLLRKKS